MDCTKKIFWVIYISYKFPVSKRQARGDAEIAIVKQKKSLYKRHSNKKLDLLLTTRNVEDQEHEMKVTLLDDFK